MKVEQQRRKGRNRSRHIINDIDPSVMNDIMTDQCKRKKNKKEEGGGDPNTIKVTPKKEEDRGS